MRGAHAGAQGFLLIDRVTFEAAESDAAAVRNALGPLPEVFAPAPPAPAEEPTA